MAHPPKGSRRDRLGLKAEQAERFASWHNTRYGSGRPPSERGCGSGATAGLISSAILSACRQRIATRPEYVNMADLIGTLASERQAPPGEVEPRADEPIWDIIELLFFAYRDFVGEPDGVLAKFAFGRAHHRVLHFVNRNPGMKVAELLDILKITKQSLARVLKQLVDQGYIAQKEGAHDRRQRLLFVTPKGEALAMSLAGSQTKRVAAALVQLGPGAHEVARRFLLAMVNSENREKALRFIARADWARRQRT
jgi:DNA-binding MarR family transcriptional regulator